MKLLYTFSTPATTACCLPPCLADRERSPVLRINFTTPADPAWAVYHSVISTAVASAVAFRSPSL
jgi:hypothetical protein